MFRSLLDAGSDDKQLLVIMRLNLTLEFGYPIKSPDNNNSKWNLAYIYLVK